MWLSILLLMLRSFFCLPKIEFMHNPREKLMIFFCNRSPS